MDRVSISVLCPTTGRVGVARVEEAAEAEVAEEEVVEIAGPEVEENALPGPIAIVPRHDAKAEPRYLQRD